MMDKENNISHAQAMILLEKAYQHQMRGQLGDAVELYKRSIAISPTAEAYTYLGWTYSMLNRLDEAIEMCREAILIDPAFGNPYNDIGAYLIERGAYHEAITWLERALHAPRYETPQFSMMNMGRAFEKMGKYRTALEHYDRALEIDELYMPAYWAKTALLGKMN